MTSEPSRNKRPDKLQRIPDTHRIRKRPPPRPAIPSPYTNSSSTKVVYISSKTPFLSAVRRTRNLLTLADKRALGRVNLEKKSTDKHLLKVLTQEQERKKRGETEAVVIKGTGKAIDKVLQLALYFQGQPDCRIRMKTGTVQVVDDIVERDDIEETMDDDEASQGAEVIPESRTRNMSVLEVAVMLR